MLHFWKKFLALTMAVMMSLSIFAGCEKDAKESADTATEAPTTEPQPTEPAEEAKVLKILTLGHSLAVDCGHMMNLILATEGIGEYDEVIVATLYYSGCPLYKHVNFLQASSPEYNLYMSSTKTPDKIPSIEQSVTMEYALKRDYWDIIIMQGGVFEIAYSDTYTDGNIQTIQNYVNEQKMNPLAYFAWHMAWATPTDTTLRDMYPKEPNTYYSSYEKLGNSRDNFYQSISQCVKNHIETDETFQFVIPSGTAIENALSSYLEEPDLHRDYAHASDLGRVIASYTWYCRLMGVEKLEEIKLDAIPMNFFKSTVAAGDRVLTDAEKAIILESVNNALANPYQMTQSQYTEAPVQ